MYRSPTSIGTISTLRLPATHPASLRCLRSAVPPVDYVSLYLLVISTDNPDFSYMGRPPILSDGNSGFSQVPVYPSYLFAHVPTTPTGLLLLTTAQQQCGSNLGYNRSTCNDISKLNSMAFRLAVYASQDGLPHQPRKTRL